MDPITIITTVGGLVKACYTVGQELNAITERFSAARTTLGSLSAECGITTTILQRLEDLLRTRPQLLQSPVNTTATQRRDLKESFETAVAAIAGTISSIQDETESVRKLNTKGKMTLFTRAKFVWKEDSFKSALQKMREQRETLGFLTDCIQTETLSSIQAHLERQSPIPTSTKRKVPPRPIVPRASETAEVRRLKDMFAKNRGKYLRSDLEDGENLCGAIIEGNLQLVELLLWDGVDPNAKAKSVKYDILVPALYFALAKWENPDSLPIMRCLVVAGANLNAELPGGGTALMGMIQGRIDAEFVSLFCEYGARWDAIDYREESHGYTALHHAAGFKKKDVPLTIKTLVAFGADLEAEDTAGETPLINAVFNQNISAVKSLLSFGADPDNGTRKVYTALSLACDWGEFEIAKVLLNAGADINFRISPKHMTPLYTASRSGHLDLVQFLLSQKADQHLAISTSGLLPIHAAAENGSVAVTKALLDAGASVDVEANLGQTPLDVAISKGQAEVVKFLLSRGANIKHMRDSYTVLHTAIDFKREDIVKIIVESGADVNAMSHKNLLSPLHMAAYYGLDQTIKLLLAQGAKIEAKNICKETPIWSAAEGGHLSSFRLLQKRGAAINNKAFPDRDILCNATEHPNMMKFLIDAGLNVNRKSHDGCTPLHWAAVFGYLEGAMFLLQEGAKSFHAKKMPASPEDLVNEKFTLSGTPAAIARVTRHIEIADLIEGWK